MKKLSALSAAVRIALSNSVIAALLIPLAILLAAVPGHGQALSGITGSISDTTGAVVSGASVTITNIATGVVVHVNTSSAGSYTVTDVAPGVYNIKVEKSGFKTAVLSGVRVDVGSKATADTVLETGGATEVVQVNASPVTLETEQPDNGTTVESKLVQELPNEFGGDIGARDRQIDNFLTLTPGVTGGSFSHRINGGVDFQNEVVFNGIPAVQSETQGMQTNINPPFELVSEFRVLNSVFSPQYGLGQGVATYGFSTGTNIIHGDVFELMRNSYFDAPGVNPNGATFDAAGNFLTKPVPFDIEHNFGFSVGGPVYIPHVYDGRNKTFFFFSGDWYRFNAAVNGTMSVPTVAEKGGDFSALGVPIFAPTTFVAPAGCSVSAGQQFPGNIIPTACFSKISNGVLPLIPDPVLPGFSNNINSQITTDPTRQFNWGFNLDHHLTENQVLHVSYWRDKWNQPNCCDNSARFAISSPLTGIKQEPRLGTGVFVTYSKTFSPNLVMTAGMGWMGEINNENNVNLGYNFPGVSNSQAFPTITFNGPLSPTNWGAGTAGEYFSHNRKLGLSWANNWLYTHGRHTLNVGWEIRRAYQDDQECQQCGGGFSFTNVTTSDPASGAGGNAFASFLLGEADSGTRQFAIEEYLRNFSFSPYVQDNLKLTRKLTVNLGLRWDILRPFTEKNNNIVFFNQDVPDPGAINPATGQPLMGGLSKFGSCSGCAGYSRASIDWHQFSPRLGFTYEMNQKTAILGGFAVNRLDGGAFEFGTNKVAVSYGNLLAGEFNRPTLGSNVPGYGEWDGNPMPLPAATPFTPSLGNGFGVNAFSRGDGFAPYNEAWNIGVQREAPGNMVLSASYLGNRGIHLPSELNPINQMDPTFLSLCAGAPTSCVLGQQWTSAPAQAALQSLGFGQSGGLFTPYDNFINDFPSANLQQALLPYPMYGSVFDNFEHRGSSSYSALQVQAEKRFTAGVSFLVNYTLSRMMSNTNSGFTVFESSALNKFNEKPEFGIDNNDQTHIVNISLVYELPIGPGKRFLNHGGTVAHEIIGGWQFSTISQYSSGTPFWGNVPSIAASGSPLNTGNRGNFDSSVPVSVNWNNYYSGQPVFTLAPFSVPTGCAPGSSCWVLGNSPRTFSAVRGPWNENENMSLAKHLYLGERFSMELRMEYFNIFNRVTICGADNNTNDIGSTFGLVNSNGSVGSYSPCQNNTPRHGQLFLKLQF
jgi:hypothetical protein